MRLDPAHFRQAIGNKAPRWPVSLNRADPLARGLAAAWPLFAGSGVGLRDVSGKGAHLALGAGGLQPSWVTRPGLDGNALDFDGGDEAHVAGGDVPSLDITADRITLSTWFRPDDAGNNNGRRVISKRTDAGGSDVYALLLITPGGGSGQVWFRLRIGGADRNLVFTTPAVTGVWQHWAATYDGATMRLYRNGIQVASQAQSGNIDASARALHLGHREAEARHFDGAIGEARVYGRSLGAREVRALYDPQTRWSLYREEAVPRAWPTAGGGGATTHTSLGSLQAVLQRQASLLASSDAALRAEAAVSALAGAALARIASRGASLDLAVQAVRQAQANLDTALIRTLGRGAGLDANLTLQGLSQRGSALDGAIRRLNLLSGALEAALSAFRQDTAALDAWLALNRAGAAGLDAVALRRGRLSDTALQAVLRATPDRAAALDAVIGLVVAAAASRTLAVGARGGKSVADGQRRNAIPPGNRRH